MSNEISRLQEQLRRTFEGEAWHGPSVLESLQGVTAEQASAHPIARAHSILELVLHLAATYRLVLRRFAGDGRPLTPEEDWERAPASPHAWPDAVATLERLHAELMRVVSGFPEASLDRPLLPESPSTAYTQIIGITQHDLYHAGQIALLKRA